MVETEDTNRTPMPRRSSQVLWAGPNSGKGRGSKGKGNKKIRTSGGDGEAQNGSGEESHVEGSYEVREISRQIKFERKRRSCSEGDYATKPPKDARSTVHFLKNGKGFKAPKHTPGHIVRLKWDEHTLNTKGAKREAFYNSCIKNFKEYYEYPKNYEEEDGDRVVRAHLKRNFKYYLGAERERVMADVNHLLDCGYSEEVINIKETMKPHYFSQRAWNAICDYWGTPEFVTKSKLGQKARKMMEFTSRTGAKPFDQRREEIDAEREAKGEMPITDDEFMSFVYDPNEPAVKDLQEKMKMVRSSQAEVTYDSPTDQPSSPATQKEIQRKKELFVTMQARPPKKGKLFLRPQETLAEIIGAREATKWVNKKQMEKSCASGVDVPDDIYLMMSTILDKVRQMVRSLPMREVKRSVLDEEVRNLAIAAFPDPSQQLHQRHYIRTASGLLCQILKDTDKIIAERLSQRKLWRWTIL